MSTNINDGGPAFPSTVQDNCDCAPRYNAGYGGMSLRDWFAGQALAGMPWNHSIAPKQQAKECYQIADAMLAARNQSTK